ncbi:MAG: efflux RND transporter permease subunit [bacterium]
MKKFFSKFMSFSQKHTVLMIFFMVILLAFELVYLKNNLKIDTDLKALFKGTNPTVKQLEKVEDLVGSYSTVLVVAHSPDKEKNIEALLAIKEKIEGDPAVRFIEFEREIDYLEKNALLFLPIEELNKIKDEVQKTIADEVALSFALSENEENKTEKKEKDVISLNSKLDEITEKAKKYQKKYSVRRYYGSDDGTFIAMKVRPSGSETNVGDTKKIVDLLDEAILETQPEKLGVTVEAGGHFRNKLKEMSAIYNDVFSTLAICVVLLCLAIIFHARSFRALLIVFLPLSAGVLSAISAMQFFAGGFNIISAFSFTILYGLGIDFAIHLLGRFSEEAEKTGDPLQALINSYSKVVPAIFSGAITTVAAFLSLTLIDFKGFADFGVAAAVGIVTSFFAILIFFPSIIFLFHKIKPLNIKIYKAQFLASIYLKISKKPVIAVALLACTVAAAIVSVNFAKIEYNFDNLSFPGKYDKTSLTEQYYDIVRKNKSDLISTGLPSFIVTESSEETEDVTRALAEIAHDKGERTIEFKEAVSAYTFIPSDQQEKLKIIKSIHRMIERKINLFDKKSVARYNSDFRPYLEVESEFDKEMLPAWIKDKMSLKDGSFDKFVIVSLGGNKSNVQDVIKIRKEYGKISGKLKDYNILGSYMLLSEIKTAIDKHVPIAILLAFCAVFATLIFLYRSFKDAFFVFLPLVSGILCMVFTAVLFGIKFNIFNMVVIPTVIGTGIDSAIYIYHRHRTYSDESMVENLKNTGCSVFFSSLTTLIGFGSVAFATHRGLQSIGIMASIGIICVTIVNLIFFPAIILFLKNKMSKNKVTS